MPKEATSSTRWVFFLSPLSRCSNTELSANWHVILQVVDSLKMAVLPQTHNTIPSPTTPKSCQQVCTLFWFSPNNYLVMQEFVRSWPIFEFSIRFHRTFVNCWISGTIKKQNKKRVLLKTDSKCNARWNALPGFPLGLENLEKWEGIFQSGNFEQIGKVRENHKKYWKI